MNRNNLAEAKRMLKSGSKREISRLEALLYLEGFRKKILPEESSYANWYTQHTKHEPYDRTDYLKAYEKGFVLFNETTRNIAAYGIVENIDLNAPMVPKFAPHHFFFVEYHSDRDDDRSLIGYLAQKAALSPRNPAKLNARLDKLETPVSQGSIPLLFGLLGAEFLAINILAEYFPPLKIMDQTLFSAAITTAGLYVVNSFIVKTSPARGLLKRMGYENYEAPAGSSILDRSYGILGLERYAETQQEKA